MQFRKNHSTCCGQSETHPCSSNAQNRNFYLLIFLKGINWFMPFFIGNSPINANIFIIFLLDSFLKTIEYLNVMSKEDNFNVVFQQLNDILFDGL